MMTEEIVKNIIDKVYPKIKSDYGLSRYNDFPNIEVHRNIYERISGIEGMEGEENAQAEHCRFSNIIYIYYSEIKNIKHVIQCLLHEYRHYLQSGTWFKRYYAMGYDYTTHPYELAAIAEESNWKKYAKKLGEAR